VDNNGEGKVLVKAGAFLAFQLHNDFPPRVAYSYAQIISLYEKNAYTKIMKRIFA